MNDLKLTNDNGYREEYSLQAAVRNVVVECDDVEDNLRAIAEMIAAMLEKLPADEALRILNAGSRRSWRKL